MRTRAFVVAAAAVAAMAAAPSAAHSRDMVARRFFAHDTPSGVTVVARLRTIGYVTDALEAWTVGENIAWGQGTLSTPARTVENWMNSQHHRDNVLDREFTEIGIGVVAGIPATTTSTIAGATYTTDFGSR